MNKAILIVEDESLVARDIQGMVNGLGYADAGICSTGEDAIQAASERKPDLILMDIVLKGAMDGVSAAARIRESQDLPIVYLTAYTDEKTLERAKRTDPHGYLLKPFEERELRAVIELAFTRHGDEKKRRREGHRLAAILDSLEDAVVACDTGDIVTFVNAMAETLTGLKPDEIMGRPLASALRFVSLKTGKPRAVSPGKLMRKGGKGGSDRCGLVRASGSVVPVDLNAAIVIDEAGVVSHTALILKKAPGWNGEESPLDFPAIHDPLTGFPNRVLFEDRLESALAQAFRKKEKLAVALLGLPHLKGLAFKEAAWGIARILRASDTIARLGEGELALLLPDVEDREKVLEVIRRSTEALSAEKALGTPPRRIAVGLALYPEDGDHSRSLCDCAETALRADRAKKGTHP